MSATQPFTVGLIQEAVGPDVAVNLNDAIAKIREAHARGAQIVCLQELFNCQYFCKAQKGERFELAEPIPGPTVTTMQALAKDLAVVLIVPIFERQAAGVYRNSAAVIDADGSLLGVYRKMHIPDDPLFNEKYYFTPGDATQDERFTMKGAANGWRVWKTRYANIGVLICWDQWYPEAARITSLLGADILFYPTAIGWHPSEKAEFGDDQVSAWRTIQRSHAIANGVYVASPNRVGFDLMRVMRTQYRIDDFQQTYFVIDSFADLLKQTVETDFAPLYRALDNAPDIEPFELIDGDRVITRGDQSHTYRGVQ